MVAQIGMDICWRFWPVMQGIVKFAFVKNPLSSTPLGKRSGYTSPSDNIPSGDNFDVIMLPTKWDINLAQITRFL
jgi:hypothetical protein